MNSVERFPHGGGELFGLCGGIDIGGRQRLIPDLGFFSHFRQGMHAVAQRDHHISRRRSGRQIVTGPLEIPKQMFGDMLPAHRFSGNAG